MAYFLVLVQFQAFSSVGAVQASQLAAETVRLSELYSVDPQLAAAIILIESGGLAAAVNTATHDYGLMQINERLAADMHLNQKCLLEWRCNMRAGIKHLAKLKRPCLYNLGKSRNVTGKYAAACMRYEAKLASFVSTRDTLKNKNDAVQNIVQY